MTKIIDMEKFKAKCAEYNKQDLKALLFHFSTQRILEELVLVDAICSCRKNGDAIPKAETLLALDNTVQGERIIINLLGRKEAAKFYGITEGITSDVKMVDFILTNDFIKYYQGVLDSQQTKSRKEL